VTRALRRSALYLPASNARAIEKAPSLKCDMVILDLEDSVAPDMKVIARAQATQAIRRGGFDEQRTLIRVNGADTPWGKDDLDAIVSTGCGVLLPKIGSAAELDAFRDRLGPRPVWAMIETARSILRLEEIACAPGIAGLVFGGNDLAKELGNRPGPHRAPFVAILTQMVAAARAYGLSVLDGVYNDIDDVEGFENEARQAADLGFDGKTLIHPKQIDACHRAFMPSVEELGWACSVRDAFARSENDGKGVIRLDGRMVERLHLHQALEMLARATSEAAEARVPHPIFEHEKDNSQC